MLANLILCNVTTDLLQSHCEKAKKFDQNPILHIIYSQSCMKRLLPSSNSKILFTAMDNLKS